MIGRLNRLFVILTLVGCNASIDDPKDQADSLSEIEVPVEDVSSIDAEKYLDFNLVGEHGVLEKEAGVFYFSTEKGDFEILTYEGLLTGASYEGEAYSLNFEPFSYFDEVLEEEMFSPNSFNLSLLISKNQNEYLGFIDFSEETKLLNWEFFECIFQINYYLNENQQNIALKFTNLGKIEWDG